MLATFSIPTPIPAPIPTLRWQFQLPALRPVAAAAPLRLRYFPRDGSIFADDEYLIRGVAGAILWKLAQAWAVGGRRDFTTRELRLAAGELRLPELRDNLDARLVLLQRRLAERGGPLRIERTGRGRYRFSAPALLLEAATA